MNIPYRTRRVLNRVGMAALALLLVMIVVWFCWVIWIERFVVYSRDGATLDLEVSSNDLVGEVAVPPVGDSSVSIYYNDGSGAVETSNELTQLEGYYIDSATLTDSISAVWDLLDALPAGTPIMIDLKGGYGSFYYSSKLSNAVHSQSVSVDAVDALIKEMQQLGFYTIARVSSLRDYDFGLNHVSSGLPLVGKPYLWNDNGGCYWLKPTDAATINWISSYVNELKEMGFNEVVLADFQFPVSDGYSYNGDKDADLLSAAQTLLNNCATTTFTLSFSVSNAAFPLPEGRCRIYLEGVDAASVGAKASQVTFKDPDVRLVFVTDANDTRFNDYSVLRPISASTVLEVQKSERTQNTEATTAE